MTFGARPAAGLLVAACLLTGCTVPVEDPATGSTTGSTTAGGRAESEVKATTRTTGKDARKALRTLDTLAVKGRGPRTGYDRDEFGQAWADVDRNGCDTRNDILRRDLTDVTLKPGTRECVVLSGELDDPYTGREIDFVRGPGTSATVQIDHVVALSDAWQKGARALTEDRREELANDPLNLLAVDGSANQSKGDGDAATWLPKRKAFRCSYVARQVAVKAKYRLWVTQAEKVAAERVLKPCA